MARRARAGGTTTATRAAIHVVCDLDTLEGRAGHPAQTLDGVTLTRDALRRLACDAEVHRIITDPDGIVLDHGRAQRTAPPSLARAIRVRDRTCQSPTGCDQPGRRCQLHHLQFWADGGPTDYWSLAALCDAHHHLVHDCHWTLQRLPDKSLRLTAPDGRTWTKPAPAVPRKHRKLTRRPEPDDDEIDHLIRERLRKLAVA